MSADNKSSSAMQAELPGKRILDRSVPLRLFLFCILAGIIFIVVFGWAVATTLNGDDRSGRFGDLAVAISSLPTTAQEVFGKISSDMDEEFRVPRDRSDLSGFKPLLAARQLDVQGLLVRADTVAVAQSAGWRVLVGAFTVDGEVRNAAIALSPELTIENVWTLTEEGIDGVQPLPPGQTFAHGFDILRDGSIVFSFGRGRTLQRVDRCGARIWVTAERFHHAVSLDDNEEFVWVLYTDHKQRTRLDPAQYFAKVSTADGTIVHRFSAADIMNANPGIDILGIRKIDEDDPTGNSRGTSEMWADDPHHFNDVDPLPSAIADRFSGFQAGDLLVSARSLNLVFVMDPDSLEVKWWRSGAVRRQHDPDWSASGEITIFNNRMSAEYSEIVAIAPESYRSRVLFDGRTNDFYSRVRGNHQITDAGSILVTSSQQGRVFEINSSGDVVLEILNTKAGSVNTNYVVTNAVWLPADALSTREFMSCKD